MGEDPDPRFTLANERTFLAWMTSAMGMLGVGLALGTLLPDTTTAMRVTAAAWIVMAAAVATRSLMRWFVVERALREGHGLPLSRSIPVVGIAIALLSVSSGVQLVLT